MIRIQIRGKLKLLHLLIASLGPHGSTKINFILHVGEFLIAHPSVRLNPMHPKVVSG